MYELREIGFFTAIGIGGDLVVDTTHIDALATFESDPDTAAVVVFGEIGSDAEEPWGGRELLGGCHRSGPGE